MPNINLLVEEFHSACASIVHEKASPALNYAVGYAQAGGTLRDPEAIRVQCLYILVNISHWRGDTAKRCREVFKRLSKAASWKAVL